MKRALLIISALIISIGCTSGEDMALLHREITDVQHSVEKLNQQSAGQSDLKKLGQHLQNLNEQTTRSNADLIVKVESLQERIEALQSSLELVTRRLQDVTQEFASARSTSLAVIPPVTIGTEENPQGEATSVSDEIITGTPEETSSAVNGDSAPDQLYKTAYSDYMQGNYDLAIQGFQEYQKRFPKTDLSDNAIFWIGECYAAKKELSKAIDAYSEILESYGDSDKAAAAQLKKGLLYMESGDQSQGVINLQYVVYEHPGSPEADLAREKLRSLGLNIR